MKQKSSEKLNTEVALQVMTYVETYPEDTQRKIARELGLSLGSVNYCIKALINRGLLKAENFRKSSNKMGYAYVLTPSGMREKADLTLSFLKRKQREYLKLEQEIKILRAEVSRQGKQSDLKV